MSNRNSDLVNFDLAKLLYELGYDIKDRGTIVPMYCINKSVYFEKSGYHKVFPKEFNCGFILAPTYEETSNWLKLKFNMEINIDESNKNIEMFIKNNINH